MVHNNPQLVAKYIRQQILNRQKQHTISLQSQIQKLCKATYYKGFCLGDIFFSFLYCFFFKIFQPSDLKGNRVYAFPRIVVISRDLTCPAFVESQIFIDCHLHFEKIFCSSLRLLLYVDLQF